VHTGIMLFYSLVDINSVLIDAIHCVSSVSGLCHWQFHFQNEMTFGGLLMGNHSKPMDFITITN